MAEDVLAFIIEAFVTILVYLPIWLPFLLLILWRATVKRPLLFLIVGIFTLGGLHEMLAILYEWLFDPAWLSLVTNYPFSPCKPYAICAAWEFYHKWGFLFAAAAQLIFWAAWIALLRRYRPRWAGLGRPEQQA